MNLDNIKLNNIHNMNVESVDAMNIEYVKNYIKKNLINNDFENWTQDHLYFLLYIFENSYYKEFNTVCIYVFGNYIDWCITHNILNTPFHINNLKYIYCLINNDIVLGTTQKYKDILYKKQYKPFYYELLDIIKCFMDFIFTDFGLGILFIIGLLFFRLFFKIFWFRPFFEIGFNYPEKKHIFELKVPYPDKFINNKFVQFIIDKLVDYMNLYNQSLNDESKNQSLNDESKNQSLNDESKNQSSNNEPLNHNNSNNQQSNILHYFNDIKKRINKELNDFHFYDHLQRFGIQTPNM
jgi:hypothetical protein